MKLELFNAILSMDAYHRGYDAGISSLPSNIGSQIGNASIQTTSTIAFGNGVDAAIGFYAVAYDIQGAGTIISYRGTDYPSSGDAGSLSDLNDWLQGGGQITGQSAMAVEFFQEVADASNYDYRLAPISTTGHSLGGGLAGLIGAIYGKDGVLFDNMAFEAAADGAHDISEVDAGYRDFFYDGQAPWDTDNSGLHTYSIQGEVLSPNRLLQNTPETALGLGSDVQFGDYSYWNIITNIREVAGAATAKHSQSTLVIRMFFADEDGSNIPGAWDAVAKYMWPLLYDPIFAGYRVGYRDSNNDKIAGQYQTNEQYADIMRTAIAYSAIDEGTDAARPFGDTAIRALYDDANDLGAAITAAGGFDDMLATDISKVFVHFAGMLALNDVEQSDVSGMPAAANDNIKQTRKIAA